MQSTDIKAKILGCIELFFLFPRGIKAFRGEKAQSIKSFLIIQLLLLPLVPITAVMDPPVGIENYSEQRIIYTVVAHYFITTLAALGLAWQVAGFLEKRDRYWLRLEAGAWTNLVFTVPVMIPLLLLDHNGIVPTETIKHVYTIVWGYGYILGACMTYAVYRINLFLIIGWTIAEFCIDRETWNFLYLAQGIPPLP
jgi:hypothetical protein